MMQVLPRWKVVVIVQSQESPFTFWISDSFLSNVLQKVAVMHFTDDGIEQPVSITVSAA